MWGHRIVLLDNTDPAATRARGLAESLPPSTRKILAQAEILDIVERANFYRSTGNTVFWGARERRIETFGGALGFQVFRPDFDRLLVDAASAAGVEVRHGARAVDVDCAEDVATVRYEQNGDRQFVRGRWVLDCSGRAGVIGRRFRVPARRTYALAGEWINERGWALPDPTHTLVEAYADGWSWSVPVSDVKRHAGVMIDGASPRRGGRALTEAYAAEIAKSPALASALAGAALQRVWACDASTYAATCLGDRRFLLVGDAASFIDPLSSFGVKKALASAWLAAIVVNTCLVDPSRESAALEFFADWDREVCATHAERSREFARQAAERHARPFWVRRAEAMVPAVPNSPAASPDLRGALQMIRESDPLELSIDDRVTFEARPVIRGREIVIEDALSVPGRESRSGSTNTTRFVQNVDLVALARLASRHNTVPDLFDAYCAAYGPAPLPNVLGGLSWLIATGVLRQRNAVPC